MVLAGTLVVGPDVDATAGERFAHGALAVARNGDGRLEAFASDSNDQMWHRQQVSADSPEWSEWKPFGGVLRSVAAEANEDGRLELWGVNSSGEIFHRWKTTANSDIWSAWEKVPASPLKSVAVGRNGDGRLEVFATNAASETFAMSQVSKNTNVWSGWKPFGGALRSLSVERQADGRLELWGIDNSGKAFHRWKTKANTDNWSAWEQMPASPLTSVAVGRNADGRMETFVTRDDDSLFRTWQTSADTNRWSEWQSAFGRMRSVAVEGNKNGTMTLLGVDKDGALYQDVQNRPSVDDWSGWQKLPGALNARTTIKITSDDQVDAFLDAIKVQDAEVRISAGVNLNLSGLQDILIAPGVQIIGERTKEFPRGPRIYTTTFPEVFLKIGRDYEGYHLTADNVRISGIRIDGGLGTRQAEEEEPHSIGVQLASSRGVKIDHSEFYGWSNMGIQVRDEQNRLDIARRQELPHITDNYFHHNQHQTGDVFGGGHGGGYGVEVTYGGTALIERNTFDHNRHAVAGDGRAGSGFLFYRNIVEAGGGWNTDVYHTHQIDMHGRDNCGIFGSYNCGLAGEYMDVAYNWIRYTAGTGVKLRGTPTIDMTVHHNLFAHKNKWTDAIFRDGAFDQTEKGLKESDNRFGVTDEPMMTSVCDFNGDGTKDHFRANGVTWWWWDSEGIQHYLNQSTLKYKDITEYRDYNGDGRCDVIAGSKIFITPADD
ncbi:tectonin domain-containing protein [Streptomyces sp. NPDC048639]|uniref:tectonin domain-containing protein n=1 Tax=Streptomyces sp. NPDC048639 TaxID=3365581 RepID=UPI0037139A02